MSEIHFYYDESEHSRKINSKTITADNYYDNFITAVVGWSEDDEASLYASYSAFESKYEGRKSKGELKSSTIKQGQLARGFASLSDGNVSLLDDFLSLFDERTLIYFAVTSKIEYVIRQLFENYENSPFVDMDAMKYSITKAVVLYQPKDIIEGLYGNTGELVVLLKKFFEEQIEKDKENEELKQKEIEQFSQILLLLNDISEIRTIDWNYDISFVGFKQYLAEKSIHNYSLTIDKEGEGSTAKAAKRVGLSAVAEADSTDYFGIRMADMLAGVISKLLKALYNALHYSSPKEEISKKILDRSWFLVNERQLSLYKKMHNVVVELNKAWYKAFAGTYSDDLIVLIAFLQFMSHFDSVEEIKNDIDLQGEYFNGHVCAHLADYYERMRNKLPIDFVSDTERECFQNQKGADVYFDINKQPQLDIGKEEIVCVVLSVGINREMIPLVTVAEENKAKCYRLPMGLAEWAINLVGLANVGENPFPAKVMFFRNHDGYYGDIL